jgi:hypothetical protein
VQKKFDRIGHYGGSGDLGRDFVTYYPILPSATDANGGGNVVEVSLSGKPESTDYLTFQPEVERLVKERGKLRMPHQLKDFHGWTLCGMWEDIKFDFRRFADIERLALFGDKRWEAGVATFCTPFTTAKVKYFAVADADKASEWVREGVEAATAAGS